MFGLGKINRDVNNINGISYNIRTEIVYKKENNQCNICRRTFDKLTADHVPPKCMGNTGRILYTNYFNARITRSNVKKGLFQNGLKVESICEKCNNEVLKICDDEIKKLVDSILSAIQRKQYSVELMLRLDLVVKGIIGHLLAMNIGDKYSYYDNELHKIFTDSKTSTHGYHFYILPYFHETKMSVIKETIPYIVNDEDQRMISTIKCYPLMVIISKNVEIIGQNDLMEMIVSTKEIGIGFRLDHSFVPEYPEEYISQSVPRIIGRDNAYSYVAEKMMANKRST